MKVPLLCLQFLKSWHVVWVSVLGLLFWGPSTSCLAQSYGRDALDPVGPYLDGVFPDRTPGQAGAPEPPPLLSQTGTFSDLGTLTPRAGLLPYGVNSPLWTDGSKKLRWVALPNDGVADSPNEKVTFSPDRPWEFPIGTVLVKQFDLAVNDADPSEVRRVETRFMVRATDGSFYGVTYQWREDGSDADLLPGGAEEDIEVIASDGTPRTQRWTFPSRGDCLACHNPASGYVLGVNTHQLNGDLAYPSTGVTDNQLRTWNRLGLFSPALDEATIPGLLRSVAIDDDAAPLEHRVRSYLDANCAQCHRPGLLTTPFDARLTTPIEAQALVDGLVLYDLGIPEARIIAPQSIERSLLHRRVSALGLHQMPPIGRNVVDDQAVRVISEWIFSLSSDPGGGGGDDNRSPVTQDDEVSTRQGEAVEIAVLANDTDVDGDVLELESWTDPDHGTVLWLPNGHARYTPNTGFVGEDRFRYVVNDGRGLVSNESAVTVQVFSGTSSAEISFIDRSAWLVDPSSASGVSIGIADMDQDGRDDIVRFKDGVHLWVDYQEPDSTSFVGHPLGNFSGQLQWGLCIADVDGNGYPDLLNGGYYDDLHLNWNEGGRFAFSRSDVNDPRVFLQAVNFVDMNGDGWLDVFACHDVGDNAKFRNAGGRSLVYDNGLLDTRTVPESDNSGNYGSVWTDYDNDGDLDLYLSKCRSGVNDPRDPRRVNMLFRKNADGSYTNVAKELGVDFGNQSWAADFGDIDNDGDLDGFVGNHGSPSIVLRNNGDGTFDNITASSGIDVNWKVIQNVFRDFNNDGWLDLLVVGVRHQLWLNEGDGTFSLATGALGSQAIESCAVGDLNADGFTDVYAGYAKLYNTPQQSSPDKLFLASPNGNGFLSVSLEGAPPNTSAVGARLELHGEWGIQTREVRGGEGYGVHHSFTQIFGLGSAAVVEKLRVRWPSGAVDEVFNPAPNQFLKLREGSAAPPVLMDPGPQANQAGETVRVEVAASDPTGDPLQFEAVNLPAGLGIDRDTGVISGTLTGESVGNYSVILRVRDLWSTVSLPFAWEVRAEDAPPAVVLSTSSSVVEGAFEATVRFTRPVTGLSAQAFEIVNGTLTLLSGEGAVYTVSVTPLEPGEVALRLPAGVVLDENGQGNLASNRLPVTWRRPATLPVIGSFDAVPTAILSGEAAELNWQVDDGGAPLTSLRIEPGVGSVLGRAPIEVSPEVTTTYTLVASNAVGTVEAETTVTVSQPLPTEDDLGNLAAPGRVEQGETVTVRVDYAAVEERELRVWLQDSKDNWRTAAEGEVRVSAGSGQQVFELDIDLASRIGDGYVWAVRLFPLGWQTAEDALEEVFGLASMYEGEVAPPNTDALGRVEFPDTVGSPSTVSLSVPYFATERSELRVYLHDSENQWFTIAEGAATVDPGSGQHLFELPVRSGARLGSGYVWALRLYPLGWESVDDALDVAYDTASVEENDGGAATYDLLTSVEAPRTAAQGAVARVTVEYEATERRDLGVWLHDLTDGWRTVAQGVVKVDPGIGTQSFDLGIASDARLGTSYLWAVRLLPEGWAVAEDAIDVSYRDATIEERSSDLVNLALLPEAVAEQSSVFGQASDAERARDGITDGDWRDGSVALTEREVDPWWQVDLGRVQFVDHVLIWNRTDCCAERLAPFHVFLSETPFVSDEVEVLLEDDAVEHVSVTELPLPAGRVELGQPARYLRIQLGRAEYLSLAEVEVYGVPSQGMPTGLAYAYYEGVWDQLPDLAQLNPMKTGTAAGATLSMRERESDFAVRYGGNLRVTAEGAHRFYLTANGALRLFLDGNLVAERGLEATRDEVNGEVSLGAGSHELELHVLAGRGEPRLELEWSGPGFGRQSLPEAAFPWGGAASVRRFVDPDRRVASNEDRDGDQFDLAAEYALARHPGIASGVESTMLLESRAGPGTVALQYRRPANLVEVEYLLEVSGDLETWMSLGAPDSVENETTAWEVVRYEDVSTRLGPGAEGGFVRLSMKHLAWNHATVTPVLGWQMSRFREGYQTHGVALEAPATYVSFIEKIERDGDRVRLVMRAGGVLEGLSQGASAIEVLDENGSAHRWEIDTDRSLDHEVVVNLSGWSSAMGEAPDAGRVPLQAVIRPFWTLDTVYPPREFSGSTDPAAADQLQFFREGRYEGYFLLQEGGQKRWAALGDPGLADAGREIVYPGEGGFVRTRDGGVEVKRLVVVGQPRTKAAWQLVRPGLNLLAVPSPFRESPATLGLTDPELIQGDTDPVRADQLRFWLGDLEDGGSGYANYFLLDPGTGESEARYWTGVEDGDLVREDETFLFLPGRAFFFHAAGDAYRRLRWPARE